MKFTMTLITAILGVGLFIPTAPAQQEIDYTQMIQDIEVMCRIIDNTLKETFEKEYRDSGFFGRNGCQGFYLKGHGVVFLINLQFPVADREIKVVKTEQETDLWEKYQREVRHQSQPEEARWVADKNQAYDEDKVDRLKQKLASVVGEYGVRIGQLGSDDMVTIVVFGRSESTQTFTYTATGAMTASDLPSGDVLYVPHLPAGDIRIEEEKKEIVEKAKTSPEAETGTVEPDKIKPKIVGPKRNTVQLAAPLAPPKVFPFGFTGKPSTTLILSFNRSQLEGKKGSDWEKLLKDAQVVQY